MNWPLLLIRRLIVVVVSTVLAVIMCNKKKKLAVLCCLIDTLLFLLYPDKWVFKDGGTTQYWAPLYTVIKWKPLDHSKTGTEVYFFPNNFVDIDDLR